MTDLGYPSKRHRGRDQPRQKKRSHVQPQQAMTSTQAMEPIIPQDYDPASQAINLSEFWGNYETGSQKFSCISSPATSYLNAGTSSGDFRDTGGYVMVPTQSTGAYSSGSNQTSEEASEQGQQTFYSPPWTPGTGCLIDREDLQGPQPPANDQQHILMHLGTHSPEPQPVYDPYEQQHAASSSGYQDLENYTQGNYNYKTSTTEPSPPPKTQDVSSPPWNQIDHRVPRYPPSFVAFELSPGPAGTREAQKNLASPPRKSRTTHKKPSNRSSKAGLGRTDKASSPGWEHIVVLNGGLEIVNENVHEQAHHSCGGRRKGALEEKAKEKAARIRRMKACWNCWLLKVPCSEGEVCERCLKYGSKKSFNSTSGDQLCSRSGFNDFEPTFFPEFLHSHLSKRSINALMDDHMNEFKDDLFEVYVTTGAAFEPMRLEIQFFTPKGWDSELLKQHHLTTVPEESTSQIKLRYAAPVGLLSLSTSELKKTLKEHIVAMVANPQYPSQTTAGDTIDVPYLILDAAREYCAITKSSLVRNALMLHAIHYYMGSLITFSPDCAANIYANCDNLDVPQEPYLSSRLLNRQLKYVMHRIHKDITREVLESLEKSMRSRTKDTWGPNFCSILVLCLCIEGLQTAADTFVVCDIKKEGAASEFKREQSWQACEAVEDYPFQKCTSLFHEIYRSSKVGNGGAREGGFNPLRAMEVGAETGLDSDAATEWMVREIYTMVYNCRETLQDLSERPAIINWGCDVDPKDIKINNTGRLAAKFLMSFFAKET